MPIPLVVWAAAGIGAAGLKLYKSATSSENMVKNAIERYNEERFKFYKVLEQLTPEVEELGRLKLHIWSLPSWTRSRTNRAIIPTRPIRISICCPRMCGS